MLFVKCAALHDLLLVQIKSLLQDNSEDLIIY